MRWRIAFLTEAVPIQRILIHIGKSTKAPRIAPAHEPPDGFKTDFDQTDRTVPESVEPMPEYDFDQTVN